jgi:hypothetical protein
VAFENFKLPALTMAVALPVPELACAITEPPIAKASSRTKQRYKPLERFLISRIRRLLYRFLTGLNGSTSFRILVAKSKSEGEMYKRREFC